jgi:hypothetical protein
VLTVIAGIIGFIALPKRPVKPAEGVPVAGPIG